MANEPRPNLFHYATSELSQDAFICWLAAWADPKFKEADPGLHLAGTDFIRSMLAKRDKLDEAISIEELDIHPQYPVISGKKRGRIDVFIKLTYSTSKRPSQKAVIVIEDKIDATLTEQLDLYFTFIEGKYPHYEKYYILLKTGYYDTRMDIENFKQYGRGELLKILSSNVGRSEIIADFSCRLEEIDDQLVAFRNKPIPEEIKIGIEVKKEDRFYLTGFHRWLLNNAQQKLNLSGAGYGYVNNLSGGFSGFWWNFEGFQSEEYWSYLQWEYGKLCFKIGFSSKAYGAERWKARAQGIKSQWSRVLLDLCPDANSKDTRIGKTMTVVKIDNALCQKEDGTLDVDQMIKKMDEAQGVLKQARQKLV